MTRRASNSTPNNGQPASIDRLEVRMMQVRMQVQSVELGLIADVDEVLQLPKPLNLSVRPVRLLTDTPWVRSLGKLSLEATTQGWKFPQPKDDSMPAPAAAAPAAAAPAAAAPAASRPLHSHNSEPARGVRVPRGLHRIRPTGETVLLKDRLMLLLQPPLENVLVGKQAHLPFTPFPYQLEGIAFLLPRYGALLADEMGLGKTCQAILALRLAFQMSLIRSALVVCPKPLVFNWARELKLWASDLPFEIVSGDLPSRRHAWHVSTTPLKIVNYELLTRDADLVLDESVRFDVVVLDEAQRIKNRDSRTAQVVRGIRRARSWAMTGTPIENRPDDLINLFAFIDQDRIPPDTPAKLLPQLTADYIIRRTKEDVANEMPPKLIQDVFIELTAAQQETYSTLERERVVQLNAMGDTITVQHVFELVMRLKQICNFDPRSGESAKLAQLLADMEEVADSGRKAIVFSQWVEPLEMLAEALRPFGPLQFHGKIPARERPAILDKFKNSPDHHVILMSYGTGSVGLNLQFTNYVFLFDRWWNPAIEDQAINRAHRVGQTSPVFVKRFITQNTIETRIAEVLERKRQIFQDLLGQNGSPVSMGLTQEEVFSLFAIKARPRKAA